MRAAARAAIVFWLTMIIALSGAYSIRADTQAATGEIVALSASGVGEYIDEDGATQPIFTGRLRNESDSDLSVVYTLRIGEDPEAGADYAIGTPAAVGTVGFHTAFWLASRHWDELGTPLDYWAEHQAVQLCIWNSVNQIALRPSSVPDPTVLARAQELCSAVESADPESTGAYFSTDPTRQINLRLNVRRATATRVHLEVVLKNAESNEPLADRPVRVSYDGAKKEGQTGSDGVLRLDYERTDETVYFDALYERVYNPGIPWISVDGTQPPLVTADDVPVDFYAEREISPSDLADKEDLAYQIIGGIFGVTGATVGIILIFLGWALNPISWYLGRRSGST